MTENENLDVLIDTEQSYFIGKPKLTKKPTQSKTMRLVKNTALALLLVVYSAANVQNYFRTKEYLKQGYTIQEIDKNWARAFEPPISKAIGRQFKFDKNKSKLINSFYSFTLTPSKYLAVQTNNL